MHVEKLIPDGFQVTFEVDDDNHLYEHIVAVKALGVRTLINRDEEDKRSKAAWLGVTIERQASPLSENEKEPEIEPDINDGVTTIELEDEEASALSAALDQFIKDTPFAIQQDFMMYGGSSANMRSVESDMAKSMQEEMLTAGVPVLPENNDQQIGLG
jgi:hypothetical protein